MTRRRFVSLACDASPTYAVLLPVTVRLWALLGYRAIVHIHEDGWDSDFGRLVLNETRAAGADIVTMPRVDPLSVANTMRCSRLLAAGTSGVEPGDFILTADVDMMPLSRSFFADDLGDFAVRRCLFHLWTLPDGPIPPIPPRTLVANEYRFPMCYSGATASIWREMLPLDAPCPARRLRDVLGALDPQAPHYVDVDEILLSRAFLCSPRSSGPLRRLRPGVWQQGELRLVDPVTAPNLNGRYLRLPRGLLRFEDGWTPDKGPRPEGAIDFIPRRFFASSRHWWVLRVAWAYFPEEEKWVRSYDRATRVVLGDPGERPELWNVAPGGR